MPIETKIAPVGKSYSALDFVADIICVYGCAKVYKLLDNIESLAVSHNLRPNTRHDPLVDSIYFILPSFTARPIFAFSGSIALNVVVTSCTQ